MREYLKSYRVFIFDRWITVTLFLLYPLIAIGFCKLLVRYSDLYGFIHQIVAVCIMIFAELVLDVFVFGGILRKNTGKLEYLKLSYKGMDIFKRSLWADKFRRLITTVFILGIAYIICHENMNPGQLVSSIFATGVVLELSLLVSRRFDTTGMVAMISYLLYLVGPLFIAVAIWLPWYCAFVFAVAYVGVVIWSNAHIMKRVGRVYYDSEHEEES